jgi:hypothetical protein
MKHIGKVSAARAASDTEGIVALFQEIVNDIMNFVNGFLGGEGKNLITT